MTALKRPFGSSLSFGSIRLRLLVAAGASIMLALVLSGWGLEVLFRGHVERRAVAELATDLQALLGALKIDGSGKIGRFRPVMDPRSHQPLSGYYWQISRDGVIVERSRSLWDEELKVPLNGVAAAQAHRRILRGPQDAKLLVVDQTISVKREAKQYRFQIAVAKDAEEISIAVKAFRLHLLQGLSLLGLALFAAFWGALSVGLSPLRRMREALGRLRAGALPRLEGHYPNEVQPLVDDLNTLLKQQERQIERGKARAANLAHGLKTPLTAISVMSEDLNANNHEATSQQLLSHVAIMNRQIEHELALARSIESHAGTRPINLHKFANKLLDTFKRLPRGKELQWCIDFSGEITVSVDETTLGEILGNLLDNARKWAAHRVKISAVRDQKNIVVTVADDGPGVAEHQYGRIIDRGLRLDENQLGSGLGLSIVAEMIEQLGGDFKIGESELGGLSARVTLKRSDTSTSST